MIKDNQNALSNKRYIPQRDVSPEEFKKQLAEIAQIFRQQIEFNVTKFSTDKKEQAGRIKATKDLKTGLKFFAETYFPHYLTKPNSKLHEELYKILPQMIADKEGRHELVEAPRGSAKSSICSVIFILWCFALQKKRYAILVMDAWEQAAIQVEALKAELESNPRLAYDFPSLCGKGSTWREGKFVTRLHQVVEGFGTEKRIRGRRHGPYRPDLAILDDIENDTNVESPRQRDKLESWLLKAVLELGEAGGSLDVIYVGTVLHHDAVIKRIGKKPDWNVTSYRSILKWPDRMDLWDSFEEIYINEGKKAAEQFYSKNKRAMNKGVQLNWPQVQSLLFLMKKRCGNHAAFESEYQNNPIALDSPFRDITYWVRARSDLVYFGAIDPSLGKKNRHSDPSAILVGGFEPETGILFIEEASIRRRLPDIIIEDAILMQRQYNCQLWFVESVQYQEFFRTELMERAATQGVAMPCFPVIPHADKALRIERLQPPMKAGLIQLHISQTSLIQQLEHWPRADHDDGPDCLEMLWTHAVQHSSQAVTANSFRTASTSSSSLFGRSGQCRSFGSRSFGAMSLGLDGSEY